MSKYPPLPIMQCDTNCGACCGVVPCTEGEYTAVAAYAQERGIEPLRQGMTCPWYQGGSCAVHPVRPAVCRLFGHTEDMECPRGYNVNLPGPLLRRWAGRVAGASRYLHEIFPGWSLEGLSNALRTRGILSGKRPSN